MQLLIANPPRSARRRRSRKAASKSRRRSTHKRRTRINPPRRARARRRYARALRKGLTVAQRKFSFRRRRKSGGGGSPFGSVARKGFVYMPKGILKDAAFAAGAGLGVNLAVSKATFLPSVLRTGYGRIGMKAGISLVLAGVVAKAAGQRAGAAVAIGGLSVAVLDLVNQFRAPKSISGYVEGFDSDLGYIEGDDDLGCDDVQGFVEQQQYA